MEIASPSAPLGRAGLRTQRARPTPLARPRRSP